MDTHGQIGPEKPGYELDVIETRVALDSGHAVYVPFAANMSRLNVVIATKDGMACPGGRPADGMAADGLWLLVAVAEKGAYWFDASSYNHGGYVAAKLDLTPPDGDALAAFLAEIGRVEVPIRS